MNQDDLIFYQIYKDKRSFLRGAQALVYADKATPAQKAKFDAIQAGLFADLRQIFPEAKDHGNTPIYLLDAIEAVLSNLRHQEQELNDMARANASSARRQLRAWDWPGLK